MGAPLDVPTRAWPLTGRDGELEAVCRGVVEGRPAQFVTGDVGTGKTRLAREALRRLADDGWPTATATATASAEATPLGALAHLAPADAGGSPTRLFEDTRRLVADRAGGQPLVLHVDDAHHLDPTSALLLLSLAESGVARLVLTVRAGRPVPDAVAALRAADRATTTTLGPLPSDVVATLLQEVLGGLVDDVAAAELASLSGGNPLYLRELVLGALSRGTLRQVAEVWRLRGRLPATTALVDQVLGRIARLDEEAREALETIAVGQPVGLPLLEAMVQPEVIEALEQHGLVRIEQHQRRTEVRLAHPIHGEVVLGSLGRMRRRRLARGHAEAVLAHGARRRGDADRVAAWQVDAGITPDLDVVLAGARMAFHHDDWPTAVRLARVAVDAGHVDAAALLAEAHYELGQFEDVDAVVAAALADRAALTEEAFAQVSRLRATSLMWSHDDSAAAAACMAEARQTVEDPAVRDLITFNQGAWTACAGRPTEALALVEPLLGSDDDRVVVEAALAIEMVAAAAGPTGRAVELADRWFPVHLAFDTPTNVNHPGNHLLTKAVALTHAGRLAEAHELSTLGHDASVTNRSLIGQMWFAVQLGRIALLRGDTRAARHWFRRQVALSHDTGHGRPVTLGLAGLAAACSQAGDRAGARAAIAELDRSGRATIELWAVEEVKGRAWARAVDGDLTAARRTLVEGAEVAEAAGIVLMGALARVEAVRLGARDQAAPLARAAPACDSALVALAARWAASTNDGDELERVAVGFEEIGGLLMAAEAGTAAATAWARAGDRRRSTAARRRADDLARACGGATPALATVDAAAPLTVREHEVARLVAEGLPTKEVAERLDVSARTVSNHLQRTYAKLGISRRTELAAALARGPDAP